MTASQGAWASALVTAVSVGYASGPTGVRVFFSFSVRNASDGDKSPMPPGVARLHVLNNPLGERMLVF